MVIKLYLLEEPFISEKAKNSMMKIVTGINHTSFKEAALADLVDTLPIIGDIGNAARMIRESNRAAKERQKFDLLSGLLPPPAGEIFDALTPTNIINFCHQRRRL